LFEVKPGQDHHRCVAAKIITDRAPTYPACSTRCGPAVWHHTEQYANNRVEADHAQLNRRPRDARNQDRDRARIVAAGHAFVHKLRRGHYEIAADEHPNLPLVVVLSELTKAI
jgi:transposase-like protein